MFGNACVLEDMGAVSSLRIDAKRSLDDRQSRTQKLLEKLTRASESLTARGKNFTAHQVLPKTTPRGRQSWQNDC